MPSTRKKKVQEPDPMSVEKDADAPAPPQSRDVEPGGTEPAAAGPAEAPDSSEDSDPNPVVELSKAPQFMLASSSHDHGEGGSDASGSDAEESGSDDDPQEQSWIAWFCHLKGNEFFVEVDEDWIQDDFNLHGLSQQVPAPYYEAALDLILDSENQEEALSEEQQEMLESAAEVLYGLIHARYILTARGNQQMLEKFKRGVFGRCPRVLCDGQETLPVGENDLPRISHVQLFCPRCEEIYRPTGRRHRLLDGAYFGTTFPHMFLQCTPELPAVGEAARYVPRVFGFKIYRGTGPASSAATSSAAASASPDSLDTPPAAAPAAAPLAELPPAHPLPPPLAAGPTSDGRKGKGTKKKAPNQGSNGAGKFSRFGT